jgi:predicted metallo-beta-lactamase superfamily hydrolase
MKNKLDIDIDGDKKTDFQIDFKTLIMVIGTIVSLTLSYSVLKSEIEIAKTLPKQIISEDDTKVVNQKIEFLIREQQRFESQTEKRLEDLEKRVFKK